MINPNNSAVTFHVGSAVRIPDVSDEDYFGEKYKDFVSNSSLKYLNPDEGGTPYNYINRSNIQSNSLELGTAVHRAVLEGDKYILCEVEKPTGKLASIVEEAYKLYKVNSCRTYDKLMLEAMLNLDYYGKNRTTARVDSAIEDGKIYFDFLCSIDNNGDKIILPADQKVRFLKAIESIKRNKEINTLLHPSSEIFTIHSFSEDVITIEVEVDFRDYWKEAGGLTLSTKVLIPLKCKIDNWSIDLDNKVITLNDLKTSSRPIQEFMGKWKRVAKPTHVGSKKVTVDLEFVSGSFQKWHYHRQMYMYATILGAHCMKEYNISKQDFENNWKVEVNMIVAETMAPFNAYTFKVEEGWLDAGREELNSLLTRLAWHEMEGFDRHIELDVYGADYRAISSKSY